MKQKSREKIEFLLKLRSYRHVLFLMRKHGANYHYMSNFSRRKAIVNNETEL